ncbi:hypothetical protein CALCODRAFT_489124 [Calocera cornea HHB12733]|uniref:Tf2-1-like SH3-like domain-containing protein n=1 Tax=Calocera cornea HHB12733 TaxID=1353952 RepID=A0A166JME0_9BASI|nr:hypothetical protein CALCODRAFT_489124 [Calocera cornea HHB12733]
MKDLETECSATLQQAADDMAHYYDRTHAEAPEYKKLDDKWFGPFKITKRVNPNAVELELPTLW